jgi:hypothetical protein
VNIHFDFIAFGVPFWMALSLRSDGGEPWLDTNDGRLIRAHTGVSLRRRAAEKSSARRAA